MRASSLVGSLGLLLIAPWYVVVACGGQAASPASAPTIEAPTASVAPAAPPAPSSEPATKAATPPPSDSPATTNAPSASASTAKPTSGDANYFYAGKGNVWGDSNSESFGAGGLGLSGIGPGAGGVGRGTNGLGGVGTLGHGSGFGTSGGQSVPTIRQGATVVKGRLPPEVIQRLVRQNFGRFRKCYEDGLMKKATLAGRINVSFGIDANGAVKNVQDTGSTLGDKEMVACVLRAFADVTFPQPESGEVRVTYPIVFTPGEAAPKAPASASSSAAPKPTSK